MKHRLIALAATVVALAVSSSAIAASMTSCNEAMTNFKKLGNVSTLLGQSYGYAVMPTIGKGGVGIGGAAGSGAPSTRGNGRPRCFSSCASRAVLRVRRARRPPATAPECAGANEFAPGAHPETDAFRNGVSQALRGNGASWQQPTDRPPRGGRACPQRVGRRFSFGGLAISLGGRPMALRPDLAIGLPLSGNSA